MLRPLDFLQYVCNIGRLALLFLAKKLRRVRFLLSFHDNRRYIELFGCFLSVDHQQVVLESDDPCLIQLLLCAIG